MVVKALVLGRWELSQSIEDLCFFDDWTPEVAVVNPLICSKLVARHVKCFFFGNEPFEDFKGTYIIVVLDSDLVDVKEPLSKVRFRLVK